LPAAQIRNPAGSGAGNTRKTGPGGGGVPLSVGPAHRFLAMSVDRPASQLAAGKCPSGQVRATPPALPAASAATRAGRAARDDLARRSTVDPPRGGLPSVRAAFPCAFRGWPAQRDQAAVPGGRPAHRPLIPLRTAGDSAGLSADTSRYRGLSRARNGFRRPVNHTGTARRSRRGSDHAQRKPAGPPRRPDPASPAPCLCPDPPAPRASRAPACGPREPGSYLHCFQCVE